jgi:ABC-type lipoprotein release transport system permease subunit
VYSVVNSLLGIAATGLTSVVQYPLRSLATVACLVAVLVPYLAGLGLSRGVQEEADDAVRFGADLYVTAGQLGRDVPIRVSVADAIGRIEGVTAVVPRIVGSVPLGTDPTDAVLVGIPPEHFPTGVDCIEGRLPADGARNELVLGSELARRLRLRVGDVIPPFYRSRRGERLSVVVGLFRSDVSLWQSHLVFTTFDTAAAIFDEPGLATDLLVTCRPGYAEPVREAVLRLDRLRVTARSDLEAIVPRGLLHREGIFNLLFVLAFAVAILVVLVTAGAGLSGRGREIGILKACGWQTDEVLLRSGVESGLLSLAGAALSLVLAYVWLAWLNGWWIASVFLAGVDTAPGFRVPYRLTPVPALLGFLIACVVVMSGTLWSSWRAATAAPVEAIRSGPI